MILTVGVAVLSALSYGVSDFFGGIGARRVGVARSTTVTYLFAVAAVAVGLLVFGGAVTGGAVASGAASGVFAVVGLLTFYSALAIGPMSLLSPLIATLGSAVPVVIAVAEGEELSTLSWVAIALALLGALLISITRRTGPAQVTPRAIVIGVVSGTTLGLSIAALDRAPEGSGLVPGMVELSLGLVVLVLLGLTGRVFPAVTALVGRLDAAAEPAASQAVDQASATTPAPRRWTVFTPSAAAGVLLGLSNALLLFALQGGSLAVVSVLIGLYPLPTIVLARFATGERLSPVQLVGVVIALAASVLLALG